MALAEHLSVCFLLNDPARREGHLYQVDGVLFVVLLLLLLLFSYVSSMDHSQLSSGVSTISGPS